MNKPIVHIILKLLIASLLVGLALDFFDVGPADLIHDIPEALGRIYDVGTGVFEWGGKYVLLGAIVVVPVWILMNLASIKNRFKRKK